MNMNRTLLTSALLLSGVYDVTASKATSGTPCYKFPQFATLQRYLLDGRSNNKVLTDAAAHFAGTSATKDQITAYAQNVDVFLFPLTNPDAARELVTRLILIGKLVREEEKPKGFAL